MKLLDAVNQILPKLGEHPVTGLSIKHPTLGIILPQVEATAKTLLIRGWWFNQFKYEALPDSEGHVALGGDVLSFIPDCHPAVLRDGMLYNSDTRSYVWPVGEAIPGTITESVPFESLPESAAEAVWYGALVTAYVQDIGMTQEVQMWTAMAQAADGALLAEHLRHRKYSTRKSQRFQRIRNAMRGS